MSALIQGLAIVGAIVVVSAAIVFVVAFATRVGTPPLWEDLDDE